MELWLTLVLTAVALGLLVILFRARRYYLREREVWVGYRALAQTTDDELRVEAGKNRYELLSAIMLVLMGFVILGMFCLWVFG